MPLDGEMRSALLIIDASDLVERAEGTDQERDWEHVLSQREQQVVALARVLVARPRFVFVDNLGRIVGRGAARHGAGRLRRAWHHLRRMLSGADEPRLHYDTVLVLAADGTWHVETLQPRDDPRFGRPAVSDRAFPHALTSPSGLVVQVNRNGSIRRMDHGDVTLNLFLGSELEGGPANLYLRRHGPTIAATPLLGPGSPGTVHVGDDRLVVRGTWQQLRFTLVLVLAEAAPAWFWHVRIENAGRHR